MNKTNNFEKQYETHGIRYQYSLASRKWEFTNGRFTKLMALNGGKVAAHKEAGFISGGLKRNGGETIDNLCRSNLARFEKV